MKICDTRPNVFIGGAKNSDDVLIGTSIFGLEKEFGKGKCEFSMFVMDVPKYFEEFVNFGISGKERPLGSHLR